MGRKYANPPVVEAVCEFRLTPDTSWDLTVPGLLYERLKKAFPHREQRLVQEVEIISGLEGVQQQIRTSERVFLLAEDRKLFVQLGPRLVAIHCLSPYPTWAGWKPKIDTVWESLIHTIDVKGLQRIGLRYVNPIQIPTSPVRLEEYFNFYPFLGENLPQDIIAFMLTTEFEYFAGRDHCRVQLTKQEPHDASVFILDIDYFLARPKGVHITDALAWVEEAHNHVEAVFEGCITDRLRGLFQEVKG